MRLSVQQVPALDDPLYERYGRRLKAEHWGSSPPFLRKARRSLVRCWSRC